MTLPSHPALVRRALREVATCLLDLVAPATCAACGTTTTGRLCSACRARLEARPRCGCRRCGEAILTPDSGCTADHAWLRWIAALRAPWRYRGTGGAIVRRFKFEGDAAAGELLVRGMQGTVRGWARGEGRRAVVVYVPMHAGRRRSRGFDQAERLAIAVSDALGLEFAGGVLERRRETLSQTDPRVTSRAHNVEGAFAVGRPRPIRGARVLLVDDVVTSGATARACAAALRTAGALRVTLLTAAVG